MNHVHELPRRLLTSLEGASVAECRAAACDRDLAEHFEGRNLGALASLCRRLATRHEDAVESLREAGIGPQEAEAGWIDPEAREFILRVAGPRQLLEVALAAESETAELYERISGDEGVSIAGHLAHRAREAAREVSEALDSAPAGPDWDDLIRAGMVPALVLGAERRLRR